MDELKTIKGIGAATAKKLADAGFATIAALAAADPATPPDGIDPADWSKWIEAAKAPAPPATEVKKPAATKADGPRALRRVNLGKKTFEIGARLPDDLDDATVAELKAIKAIN